MLHNKKNCMMGALTVKLVAWILLTKEKKGKKYFSGIEDEDTDDNVDDDTLLSTAIFSFC